MACLCWGQSAFIPDLFHASCLSFPPFVTGPRDLPAGCLSIAKGKGKARVGVRGPQAPARVSVQVSRQTRRFLLPRSEELGLSHAWELRSLFCAPGATGWAGQEKWWSRLSGPRPSFRAVWGSEPGPPSYSARQVSADRPEAPASSPVGAGAQAGDTAVLGRAGTLGIECYTHFVDPSPSVFPNQGCRLLPSRCPAEGQGPRDPTHRPGRQSGKREFRAGARAGVTSGMDGRGRAWGWDVGGGLRKW